MNQQQSNRRQFLTGRAVRNALAQPVGMPFDPGCEVAPLLHLTRRAMACGFSIFLDATAGQGDVEAAMEALDLLEPIEAALSIYRPDSEISQLNRSAAEPMRLSPLVLNVLTQAKRLHALTEGAFDITAGPLARVWGFTDRAARRPAPEEVESAMSGVGANRLTLDTSSGSAQFETSGMEVNLAAIGKGFALDQCAQLMQRAGVERFLIHGGLSSIRACGSRSLEGAAGWTVEVKHPNDPNQVVASVRLNDQSLGTSGTSEQHFVDETGQRWGHIIDPRSGYPTEPFVSASAIAPTAAEADALATAFYVMGRPAVKEFCERHTQYGAVLVTHDVNAEIAMEAIGNVALVE